ncbi:MAG: hypothetical protein AUJ70_00695 [Candidatus Omnitrophica bacterium CG1_02_40_15]|nr:MAG: hypothetical protein AUJ70_00695 [Candidatus Omnitrophica bacterium CG1_02_40_15]
MKITNPLDEILNNETKIKILRFLFRTNAEWNGRQIAMQIKRTPAATHKALQVLHKEGVLILHNIGKTHVYTLNKDNFAVTDILKPLFEKENKILLHILDIIRKGISASKVRKHIKSVALFGSVNYKQDHSTSDIDLAVIIDNIKFKPMAELLFEEIDKKISRDFGNALSPYVQTEKGFKNRYRKGFALIKNIMKSYKLIYGSRLETIIWPLKS